MKILVTGATGFIGGRIVDALLSEGGHSIVFSGRTPPKGTDFLARGAQFKAGDIADPFFAELILQGVEAVIHCAGKAGTWGPLADYRRANVEATRRLLEAARRRGARRFVNLSSPSVYFDFTDRFDLKEDQIPERFADAYAETKFEAEEWVSSFHSADFETVSLRPRSVIGAGDQNVLPRLLRLQRSGRLVQVGDGTNRVDTTNIKNLIEAVGLCLRAPSKAMGHSYNISDGAPVRFWDFVDQVMESVGLPTERRKVPYGPLLALARLNQWRCQKMKVTEEPSFLPLPIGILALSMTMDISKARHLLGYQPRYSTTEGIQEFATWWKSRAPVQPHGLAPVQL